MLLIALCSAVHKSSYAAFQLFSVSFLVICLSDCCGDNWPFAKLDTFCFEIIIVWARQFPEFRVVLIDLSFWLYIFRGLCWWDKKPNFYIGDSHFPLPHCQLHFSLVPQMSWWQEATLSALGMLWNEEGGNTMENWGHQTLEKHSQIRAVFKWPPNAPRTTRTHIKDKPKPILFFHSCHQGLQSERIHSDPWGGLWV